MWTYNYPPYLVHHGILGQKWGIRRYQNEDGSLTSAGKRHLNNMEKKDVKWANKNHNKIYKKAYDSSKKELQKYMSDELNLKYKEQINNSKISKSYINDYNKKMAELMNSKVSNLEAPSGKIVQFVAKRGEVGVHLALADKGYDMSQLKNGIWNSGRVAYKNKSVNMA